MGATKFKEDTVKVILDVISETNSEQAAYKAAGVGKSTYFGWKRTNPDFAFQVKEARSNFLEKNFQVFRVLGINALYDALTKGAYRSRTTTVKELMEVPGENPDDPPKLKLQTVKVTTVETQFGVPQWAVERVLGKTVEEIEAVNRLIESGWFDPKAVSEIPVEMDKFVDRTRDILLKNAIK